MSAASIVSWTSDGGIQTKNAPLIVQPGSALLLDNVRQERKNEWRTRPGSTHDAIDDLPGANVPVMCTPAPWGGFVGLCREATAEPAGRIYSPGGTTARWTKSPAQACAQLGPGVWSRTVVGPSNVPNVVAAGGGIPNQTAIARGGNFQLSASWNYQVANNTGVQVTLQTAAGVTIQAWQAWNSDTGANRPRCVYSAAANMLVLFWIDAAGEVCAYRWNATTGVAVAGVSTLRTDAYNAAIVQGAYIDALSYGGATVTVVYRNRTGAGQLVFLEYNPATDVVSTSVVTASVCSGTLALFADPDASGTRLVGISSAAAPDTRVLRMNSAGTILTNQVVDAVRSFSMAGVAYNAGVDWMVVYGTAGDHVKAAKFRATVLSGAIDVVPAAIMSAAPVTGAWREPGTDAMRYVLLVNGQFAADAQPTYLEMALEFENGSPIVTNLWPEPQAKLLPLNAGSSAGVAATCAQVQRLGADNFLAVLGRITELSVTSDGQSPTQYAIDTWTVQYLNTTTYTNQNIGTGTRTQQDVFLPSGSLLQTATGQLICAHGSSALPFIPISLVPSVGAGTLNPAKAYSYATSVLMPDEAGNDWRSPIGAARSVTPGGANNTITFTGALTPLENQQRRRVVLIWRTDGDGATYKLLHIIDSTVALTTTFTFVDATGDVGAGQEYQFNIPGTTGGELPPTITPALSHVAEWNGRLWGIDRDFPSRVRYSKPLSAGLLPEFPDDFVVDIDDAEGPGTGLAAMDDKIVLFKGSAAYVAGGDGPENDGTGASFSFQLISSECGSTVGSPLLSTGSEVYTVSEGGVFRLKRSQEFDFVGAAIDRYLAMPLLTSPETVTGMVLSSEKNEVRVQTTNYRFVHDRIFDIWERDTGGMNQGIAFTRMLGTRQAMFLASGALWLEAPDSTTPSDAGTAYAGSLRGPWMRPMNMEGWLNLYRVRALGECTAAGTTLMPAVTIYFDNSDAKFEIFQPRGSLTNAVGPIRADFKTRQQLCTAFSPQLTLPQGDATIRFDSWSALVAPEPGMQGLGGNVNWQAVIAPAAAPPTPPLSSSLLPRPLRNTVPVVVANPLLGSVVNNQRQIVLMVLNAYIAGGWRVVQSYAATGVMPAPGVNSWLLYTDLKGTGGGGTGKSYIVLGNATNTLQILLYVDVTFGWLEMRTWLSGAAGFTGGTTLARPTATDEIPDLMQSTNPLGSGGAGPVTDPQFYAAIWVASDFSYTRAAYFYAGHVKTIWQFDVLTNAPTGWSNKSIFIGNSWGNTDFVFVGGRPTLVGFTTIRTSGGCSKTLITPAPNTLTEVEGELGASNGGYILAVTSIPNGFSNQYLWDGPLGISKRLGAANVNGFWGFVIDQWWLPLGFNDCDTMGDNNDFIILGQMVLQWGIGVPSLGGSPPANYPTARFYGRSMAA